MSIAKAVARYAQAANQPIEGMLERDVAIATQYLSDIAGLADLGIGQGRLCTVANYMGPQELHEMYDTYPSLSIDAINNIVAINPARPRVKLSEAMRLKNRLTSERDQSGYESELISYANFGRWHRNAACSPGETETFDKELDLAQKVCGGCVVRLACLEDALMFPQYEQYGYRGGMTSEERRQLIILRNQEARQQSRMTAEVL